MSYPTYVPHGWVPPRPPTPRARIHTAIALGVIGIVGAFGSMIAFFAGAFLGDACGFADSPPICYSAGAAWGVMLEPALATAAAGALAVVGLVRGGGHRWPVAAWVVWVAGGAGWLLLLSVFGVR